MLKKGLIDLASKKLVHSPHRIFANLRACLESSDQSCDHVLNFVSYESMIRIIKGPQCEQSKLSIFPRHAHSRIM